MFDDEDDDNSVGYGNPPKNTQFKKGKSGNPKGRPPEKVLHLVVEQILNEKVTIMVNGEKKMMTKKEAVFQQLINESMKGKSTATKTLIYLLKSLRDIDPM